MSLSEYFQQVKELAGRYGYSEKQVKMFSADIDECYVLGLSVERCVEKVF